jgi:hypothetical protein
MNQENNEIQLWECFVSLANIEYLRFTKANYFCLSAKTYADIYLLLAAQLCKRYDRDVSATDIRDTIKPYAREIYGGVCHNDSDEGSCRVHHVANYTYNVCDGRPTLAVLECFLVNKLPSLKK